MRTKKKTVQQKKTETARNPWSQSGDMMKPNRICFQFPKKHCKCTLNIYAGINWRGKVCYRRTWTAACKSTTYGRSQHWITADIDSLSRSLQLLNDFWLQLFIYLITATPLIQIYHQHIKHVTTW